MREFFYMMPAGLYMIIVILAIIYALLMFCLPFFVYSIRNETIRQRRLLKKIADALDPAPKN